MAHGQHGFTLWELLMTLLVAGVLFGIGVPNVLELSNNATMTAAANNIVTGVLMARTEAVKRQAPVTLCFSDDATTATPTCSAGAVTDGTTRGFFVFVDDNDNFNADGTRNLGDANDGNGVRDANELVLMQSGPPGGSIRLSANCGYVSFAPTGFTRQAGGLCFPPTRRTLLCDDRGRRVAAGSLSSARAITIDPPGHSRVLSEQAAVNTLITDLAAVGVNATCP